MTFLLIYLQEKNKICVQLLNAQGYNVDLLAAKLSKEVVSAREKRTVTYPKEWIKDTKSAKNHGDRLLSTYIMHATNYDFFISDEKNKGEQEYADLLKERLQTKIFKSDKNMLWLW